MPDRLLYATPIPRDAQTGAEADRRRQLSKQGRLQQDVPQVTGISSEAGEERITGWARGKLAPLTAGELNELFQASNLIVPYFARDERTNADGYYQPEAATVRPEDPRELRVQRFDGQLTKVGSRRSHWRAVATTVTAADNPFGGGGATEIAISARASNVRWYDADGAGGLEDATEQRRETGEHALFSVYDVAEPSFDNPWLLYSLAYEHEARADVQVWDDYGRAKESVETENAPAVESATVGDSLGTTTVVPSRWQRVYATDHDYSERVSARPIIESDRLRFRPDEARGRLIVYRWNVTDEHWDLVQLGASDWHLLEWDIRLIDLSRVASLVTFQNVSTGATHDLWVAVRRGLADALIINPENESSVPSGLVDRLDPVASDAANDPGERADVLAKSEV